jgi:hypothetical protein
MLATIDASPPAVWASSLLLVMLFAVVVFARNVGISPRGVLL